MQRLQTIVQHIAKDNDEMIALKKQLALASLEAQFNITDEQLRQMALYFIHEMHKGLETEPSDSTLPMLPSFVFKRRPEWASGSFYALDLGGTNFRVIKMDIRAGKLVNHSSKKYTVPKPCMVGTAQQLFDFIAASVEDFLALQRRGHGKSERDVLGFTFSFPIDQTALAAGALRNWTKGYSTEGVEKKDVVELLQQALDRKNIPVKIVALCNDTVGTLVARCFGDAEAQLGVIVGTGSNACYWEKAANVKKCPAIARRSDDEMCINMEFGNFDSKHCLVRPCTSIDELIDLESKAEKMYGRQRFEKMVSGFYLGEVCRHCILFLVDSGVLPEAVGKAFNQRFSLSGIEMTNVLRDLLPGCPLIAAVLKSHGAENVCTETDLLNIQKVCRIAARRSARLAGMAIGATLMKTGKQANATVAVDGSVFEHVSGYRKEMHRAILTVVGQNCNINLVHQSDGSGHGAGYIAALAQFM